MPPIGVRPGQADKPPSRAPAVGGGLANLAQSIARSGGSSGSSVGQGLRSVAHSAAASPAYHSTYKPSLPSTPSTPAGLARAYGASLGPPAGTRLWGLARLPLSGQVKAIHDLLSKGGYVQYGSATGQDPWKLLYKDSNSYDRNLLSAIQRNVTYAQALRSFSQQGLAPELTRQAVNAPLRELDLGGRLPRLPAEPPNPQNLGPVPTSAKGFVNYHGTQMRQPYTPMWRARTGDGGWRRRGQRDIYTGKVIPANVPILNMNP